ncbi:MAG: leishmanolysin-related zinc metalloendopeptidase [Gemmatimonadales bacterium]|nr:leishmanolysin-related zinc metalloendopeptidase [Gemmatimonadales bacterium]
MPAQYRLIIPQSIVAASLALAACGSSDPGVQLGPPTQIQVLAGANQQGTVGAPVAIAPVVRVVDGNGRPASGISVRFDVFSGGGSVVGESVVTNGEGTATLGQWLLGQTPGTQQLRVQAIEFPLQTIISATAAAGPPATIQPVGSSSGLTAIAGELVLPAPTVLVRDGFGNQIGAGNVSFEVILGGGSVTGAQQLTDAQGRATVGSWRTGTTPGLNRLLARTSNGLTTTFNANSVAAPGSLTAASVVDQAGVTNFAIPIAPRVIVRNQAGQPISGISVVFRVTEGNGTLTGDTVATGADGIAAVRDWRLGTAANQAIRATVPGFAGQEVEFRATATPRPFTIDVRFVTSLTPSQRDVFVQAALRWMDIIVGDLPDQLLVKAANSCFTNSIHPAINEVVDDLIIFAAVTPGDGPGGVLGSAGFCSPTRNGTQLPLYGVMDFDSNDLSTFEANGRLSSLILHEMGHVLGIGTAWASKALIQGAGTSDPVFTGVQGRLAWPQLGITFGGTIVPIENEGTIGGGTRDVHWRESVLDRELMTGFLDPLPVPLSVLTAASLIDHGYTVNVNAADPFTPAGLRADGRLDAGAGKIQLGEILVTPSGRIMPDGKFVPNN